MNNPAFVIGDIHGCLSHLQKLLKRWNPDKERLIFLGDLIDRGEDSYGVVKLAMKLRNEYGAVVLGGNHEKMFLEWLEAPLLYTDDLYRYGGQATLDSFFSEKQVKFRSPVRLAARLKQDFSEEIAFLSSLSDYKVYDEHILVHAGIDLEIPDWKKSGSYCFRTIREPFHFGENESGKTIVFGHTPTKRLHRDKRNDVWISPCQTKIGIDGGAVFGGFLHGLVIKGNGEYRVHSVNHRLELAEKSFFLNVKLC